MDIGCLASSSCGERGVRWHWLSEEEWECSRISRSKDNTNAERRALTCHPDCSVCIYAVWSLDGDENVVLGDGLEHVMNQPGNSLCAVLASLKGAWQVKSAGLSLTTGVARRNRSRWTGVA